MAWDPAQYLKFAGPRLRPAIDLLGHIEAEAPKLVYDLGCGAGNVTRFIAERWPQARIVGLDGSAEMLAKAKGCLAGDGGAESRSRHLAAAAGARRHLFERGAALDRGSRAGFCRAVQQP